MKTLPILLAAMMGLSLCQQPATADELPLPPVDTASTEPVKESQTNTPATVSITTNLVIETSKIVPAADELSPAAADKQQREIERQLRMEEKLRLQWEALSTEDKWCALDWYRRLKDLPAEEQSIIRSRTDRYLRMNHNERRQLAQNYERWTKMTEEEREKARLEYRRLRWEFEKAWQQDHPNEPLPAFKLPLTEPSK